MPAEWKQRFIAAETRAFTAAENDAGFHRNFTGFHRFYRGKILNLKVKFERSAGISVFLHIFSFAKGVVCDELIKARRLKLG